jgi:hypothetical protein
MKQTDEKGNPLTYWGGLEEPKQETLNEVALEFAKDHHEMYETSNFGSMHFGFCWGAKWQQEQYNNKYSEEEVLKFAKYILSKEVTIARSTLDLNSYLPKEFQLLSGELEHNGKELLKEWLKQFKNK